MKVYHYVILEDINLDTAKIRIILAIPKTNDTAIEDVNITFIDFRRREFFKFEQIHTSEKFIFFQGIVSLKVSNQYFYYFYWFENNRKKKYRLHESNMTTERDCWKIFIREDLKNDFLIDTYIDISERDIIKKICKHENFPDLYVSLSMENYNKKDLEYTQNKVLRYDKKLVLIPRDSYCLKDDEIQEFYKNFLNQKIGIMLKHIVF